MSLPDGVLAFDPGRQGSAVLLALEVPPSRKGVVLAVVPWRKSIRKGVRGYLVLGVWVHTVAELVAMVWAHMALGANIVGASVEGMVLPKKLGKGGKSEKSLITLFEETGACVDAVRRHGLEPSRPSASYWRGKVLRIGFMSRERAEARAMKCREFLFEEGHGLDDIHSTEAGCMSLLLREVVLSARTS